MNSTTVGTSPRDFVLLRLVVALAPMVLVHIGAVAAIFTDAGIVEWSLLLPMIFVRGLIVTVCYHRYFAHRSFRTSRIVQFVMALLCCVDLQQGPLWWAGYHRKHHRHADQPGDAHSPYYGGFWWAYCGWLFVPLAEPWERVREWRRCGELVWLERFWQLPGLLVAGLFWWFGGWSTLCIDFCLSAVVVFHISFLVNTAGHLTGSRRFPTHDHSRNSVLLGIVSLGEGWHNNHHRYPHAAHLGLLWWETDLGYVAICVLEKLRLVWDVRRVDATKTPPAVPNSNRPAETITL